MKKTIISLFLVMTLIVSMTVNVFAVDDARPLSIRKTSVEQVVTK